MITPVQQQKSPRCLSAHADSKHPPVLSHIARKVHSALLLQPERSICYLTAMKNNKPSESNNCPNINEVCLMITVQF